MSGQVVCYQFRSKSKSVSHLKNFIHMNDVVCNCLQIPDFQKVAYAQCFSFLCDEIGPTIDDSSK